MDVAVRRPKAQRLGVSRCLLSQRWLEQGANWCTIEIRFNVLDDLGIPMAVGLLADVSEMRRSQDVRQPAKGIVIRQGFFIEDIESCSGNGVLSQGGFQGLLIDDGPARGVDQIRPRFHHP